MESRKPVLDLKDVPHPPAPLHHNVAPQLFSLASFPIPPPPCLPPPPSIPQQPAPPPLSQQQQGSSPKVSTCSYCEYCGTGHYNTIGGGAGVGNSGSNEGPLSFYIASDSLRVPSPNTKVYSSGPCSKPSSVQYKHNLSCGSHDESLTMWSSHSYTSQLPSSVATSQPVSSNPYAPGCSELLLPYPSLSCSQSNQFPSSAPPVPSLPSTCAPLHGSCLASSGYYPCGVDCSPLTRRAQRSTTLGDHTTTTISTTTTSSHFCSIPMHLNIERTVGVKGAQHCQECLLKSAPRVVSESDKGWPNVPLLQTAPIPICNGCNTSAEGKTGQKYGSPESGGSENIPPVGVFWDIENCSVPSGRSAAAVVERIRSRFFQGHREAEFICVCDISKESKCVIQELNNCQVTVAHINATAKNAADDKLRQSLRRFAETHTAPATVVLVSSDVNFASELSDLRHRHGFQVILVHNHASPALLQHANCHVAFQELTADLPPRMPTFNLLYVHNLPIARDKSQLNAVKLRLRRLSANCGGKVLGVSFGTAVLRFGSPAAAARACKRMENEDVFGHRISASFSPWPTEEPRPDHNFQAYLHQVLQALPQPLPIHSPMFMCSVKFTKNILLCRRDGSSPRSTNEFPIERERTVGEFQISTPSAFSKLNLQQSFSPHVLSQGSWSSRSVSPCLSSRSSPLLAPPRSPCPETSEPFSDGAEVQAANLDYRMSRKDLQQTLHETFSRYGQVKSVELSPHTDYQLKATVQMVSLQDAISAVSGLHRYKIGGKRIQVSLVTGGSNKSLTMLSSEIISILQDAPANCLPLFKFTEIYEKKYFRKLMVGDLYRLPEVVSVREQAGSRLVCLLHSSQIRQSPLGSSQSQEGSSSASGSPVVFEELEYHEPICRQHYAQQDFSEADFDPDAYKIPFVVMSVSALTSDVHTLLHSHEGTLPLLR
uniref:Meiosis regulator and mRNA stability factor 1 n=1 Tax=Periophthalmus magnuspinnatus TaxID=409849 RepID=A0A3B3ZX49_9GOBI